MHALHPHTERSDYCDEPTGAPLPAPGEPAPDHRRPTMGAHGVIRHRLRLERQPGVNLGDGGGDALAVESACVLRRALRAARCGCLAPGCEADAMLEGDGGHIKELYRRGQAHEQLGTDRLGLAMKHYTGCSTCGTRAEDKAGSICRLHQPSSTAARAHQRAWPRTCPSSASMRFP